MATRAARPGREPAGRLPPGSPGADARRPAGARRARPRVVLGRRGRRSRDPVAAPAARGARRLGRRRMGALVVGRPVQLRGRGRRRPSRAGPGRPGDRLGRRGRPDPPVDERRPQGGRRPCRRHARRARRRARGAGRHLPAEAHRDPDRRPRPRQDRRDLHTDLLGLRRARGRRPAPGLWRDRAHHRRRLPAEGVGRPAEGDSRCRRGSDRAAS